MSTRMPFGKYKGLLLSEVPDDYLDWLSSLDNLREPLRLALADELRRRSPSATTSAVRASDTVVIVAEQLIGVGYRAMALRCHPDTGGTHEQMVALNEAAELLRRLLP